MKIFKRWHFWALVGFVVVWVLVQTFFPPTTGRIKQLMKAGAKAIEHENVNKIISLLHPEFQAETGMDSEALRPFLAKIFMKYADIRVVIEDMRVDVKNKQELVVYFSAWAEATIAATMTDKLPIRETGATEEAEAVWRKTNKGWKLFELRKTGLEDEF